MRGRKIGHIVSEETRKKISLAQIGKESPMKGKHHSKETKKKLRDSQIGKKLSQETKDKISKRLKVVAVGRKLSQETKEKIRKAHIGKSLSDEHRMNLSESMKRLKEQHHNWRGGITTINELFRKSLEYKFWRREVFLRDNFICQKCGQLGGELRVHHINNFADFPELRLIIENGITLCDKCHNSFHSYFGKKNNTKEQIEEFIIKKDYAKWKL